MDEYVFVTNIPGTSNESPAFYDDWIDFAKAKLGWPSYRPIPCAGFNHHENAEVGAHVFYQGRRFIVPVCQELNMRTGPYRVNKKYLVPLSSKDIK